MDESINIRSFTDLLKDTYSFNQLAYDQNPGWGVLLNLYNQNYIFGKKDEINIPKKIHQVWLGSPVPERYNEWRKSWKRFNPNWEYRLWTDDDLNPSEINITNWTVFNSITNMGQKSDYLRYHILNQYGGLYADTDYECLKPFDELRYAKFLAGISYDAKPIVNIAILGSVPGHPILQNVLKTMVIRPGDSSKNVMSTSGPYFFTKSFFETIGAYMEGVVILPPQYLYPFPNELGFKSRNGRDYIKDYSYAIHYWDVSWIKVKK